MPVLFCNRQVVLKNNRMSKLFNTTLTLAVILCMDSCSGQNTTVDSTVEKQLASTAKSSKTIIQDHNGNIWICGSFQKGVTVFDGRSFKNFQEKDGLSADAVNSILETVNGSIWFATDNGITIFDAQLQNE